MSEICILAITLSSTPRPSTVLSGQFSSLQRLSSSPSFKIDGKIWQRNSTRIDRTIQKFCARRTDLVVSYGGAWVTSAVSALSVQRAHFTFSTQGILAHSKARGGEAGAQPAFFMSARPQPQETSGLSLARLCTAQRSDWPCEDGLKKYKPQQVKDVK